MYCSQIKGQYKYEIIYEGKGFKQIAFTPKIIFEGHFHNDHIELFQNKKALIDKRITTDDRIGVASYNELNLDSNSPVFFQFNNDQLLTLDSIRSYPYVYFSKDIDSNTLKITYSINKRLHK